MAETKLEAAIRAKWLEEKLAFQENMIDCRIDDAIGAIIPIVQQELAAAESLFVKILNGQLPPMAASDCDGIADALASHDAELRERVLTAISAVYPADETTEGILHAAVNRVKQALASSAANSPEPRT